MQIESGWTFSTVLMQSGDVLVFDPFSGAMQEKIAAINEELDRDPTGASKAKVTSQEPAVIPCHSWIMRDVEPIRLPAITSTSLPDLLETGLSDDERAEETKLVKIAGMDNAVIGLTNKGHVLKFNLLSGEDASVRGSWEYVGTDVFNPSLF